MKYVFDLESIYADLTTTKETEVIFNFVKYFNKETRVQIIVVIKGPLVAPIEPKPSTFKKFYNIAYEEKEGEKELEGIEKKNSEVFADLTFDMITLLNKIVEKQPIDYTKNKKGWSCRTLGPEFSYPK